MILVLLGFAIAIFVIGAVVCCNAYEDSGAVTMFISGIGVIILLIAAIIMGVQISNLAVIDDKIEMYQEENQKIETQIAETVQQYREYESGIFTKVAPESSVTLVALYPELKADTLVQKQIEIYIANNEKIKALKESDITGDVKRWWLYFGGKK